jgi:hypothetical protein
MKPLSEQLAISCLSKKSDTIYGGHHGAMLASSFKDIAQKMSLIFSGIKMLLYFPRQILYRFPHGRASHSPITGYAFRLLMLAAGTLLQPVLPRLEPVPDTL